MLKFIKRRSYATEDGKYTANYHPYYKVWTVKSDQEHLSRQFKTLRQAENWVRDQYGIEKLKDAEDVEVDKKSLRKKKAK